MIIEHFLSLVSACRAGVELWARNISDELGGGAGSVTIARTVHSLHFLVDEVSESLWSNGLGLDPAAAHLDPKRAVTLRLTWPALGGLFGLTRETGKQEEGAGGVGGRRAAVMAMPQHLCCRPDLLRYMDKYG